jgi:Spy/CpxP family protein refolding chaperone
MKKIIAGALAFLLVSGVAQAQDSTRGRHNRKHPMEQLNLTADQKTKLEALRAAQKKEWSDLKNNQAATAEGNKKQRQELQQKYQAQIKAILTPEQQAQMAQSRKEHRKGPEANGQRKGLKETLNLTEAQQTKMSALNKDFKTKRESLRSNTSLTADQKKEQMKALVQQHRSEVKSILTPEQQQKLEAMPREQRIKRSK